MKIAIGGDHGGFDLKEKIKLILKSKNHDVIDLELTNLIQQMIILISAIQLQKWFLIMKLIKVLFLV